MVLWRNLSIQILINDGSAKFTGNVQPCKINLLRIDLDDCPRLTDFSSFKNCNIYDLTVSCHTPNKLSIDFNGLNIKNELIFYGYYGYTGKNTHELTVTGKYDANNIQIHFLKVYGLPQKISGRLHDNEGLSWWNNDIQSIGEKLVFGIPKETFKEIYDAITSKNTKLPKLNMASFDTNGWSYYFNNSKDMLIALQAGYMRKVDSAHGTGEMCPGFNSYELEFKTNVDGEYILKQWLDNKGYKLINDYDLKPTNMDKMLHTQQNRIFHVFDKKDKIVATYHPLSSLSNNTVPYIISTDKNIIDEIKNIK